MDADTGEPLDTTVASDSSGVRAHQHAGWSAPSVSGRKGSKQGSLTRVDPDGREALGRSRGGLITKVQVAAALRCRPIVTITIPGQRADSVMFTEVMTMIRYPKSGPGRPRTTIRRVLRIRPIPAKSSASNSAAAASLL